MFSILIIDDDLLSIQINKAIIETNFPSYHTFIDSALSLLDAQKKLAQQEFDLVLLDIKLPNENGFDLIKNSESKKSFEVVIVSGSENHAIEAFRYNVFDYIVKPPKKEDFERIFQRLYLKKEITPQPVTIASGNKINIPTSEGLRLVKPDDIVFLEADNLYCTIFLNNKEQLKSNKTLKYIEALLPGKGFYRIQKSYLINLKYIKKISKSDGGLVQMEGYEMEIPISKNVKNDFFSFLSK